jgi:DNA-binding NarL/FixJ family response regulator
MSLLIRLLTWLGVLHESTPHPYEQNESFSNLSIEPAQRDASQDLYKCWEFLSPREQEVTALICLGYTNDKIASKLGVSPTTVKSHIRNILAKFQMHGKVELRIALKEWDFEGWD